MDIKRYKVENEKALEAVRKAQKRLSTALAERMLSRANLDCIIDAMPEAIIVVDSDCNIIEPINKASSKLFGFSKYELLGDHIATVFPPPYDIRAAIDTVARAEARHKDGKAIQVTITTSIFNVGTEKFYAAIINGVA